jgi:hypothetical protein
MIKKFLIFALVAIGLGLAVPRYTEAQADYLIGQNRPPVCNPNGLIPYLYYNVSNGHWTCTASPSPLQGAVLGDKGIAGALSDRFLTKEVTGVADNTFTDVFTVTVPNAAHAAVIPIVLMTRLGAGGAIGADECVGTAYGQLVIARTAGLATVATATTLSNTGSSCVAGATTIATAYQVSSVAGANSATQTFTIQGRVTKGAGSSTNHKIDAQADLLNANAAGITIQ